jgi:2',3'-cyclic-nucleotide 2'-phosphodiesterase (5'-nucleotidase family)
VFEGDLYEALVQKGRVKLRPTSRLLLRSHHHDKPNKEHKEILVDVVQSKSFGEYLSVVESDIDRIKKHFDTKKAKLLKAVDKSIEEVSKYNPTAKVS